MRYLVFFNSQKSFWCSDHLPFCCKRLYNLTPTHCLLIPQGYLRCCLSDLSAKNFCWINRNSQLLDRDYLLSWWYLFGERVFICDSWPTSMCCLSLPHLNPPWAKCSNGMEPGRAVPTVTSAHWQNGDSEPLKLHSMCPQGLMDFRALCPVAKQHPKPAFWIGLPDWCEMQVIFCLNWQEMNVFWTKETHSNS